MRPPAADEGVVVGSALFQTTRLEMRPPAADEGFVVGRISTLVRAPCKHVSVLPTDVQQPQPTSPNFKEQSSKKSCVNHATHELGNSKSSGRRGEDAKNRRSR